MKKVFAYIFIGILAASTVSCNKFLDKAPILSQSTDLTLSSYDGLNKSVIGAYSLLASATWYGGERVLESEMRSGNGIKDASHNSNRYATHINWNYSPDATSELWSVAYITISRANNVIDNLEGKDKDGVTAQDLDNLKAECLFIRALAHFDLVTLYAQPYSYATSAAANEKAKLGVPYVYHTDPTGKPARESAADTYAKVVEDLLLAESLIDPSYTRSGVGSEKAVVSIYAIQALLSRVYLYMGKWQDAANYATKVIESQEYTLYDTSNYTTSWNGIKGGSEVIFEAFVDINNRDNTGCPYMTNPNGSYGDCIASPELVGLYEPGDVRLAMYAPDANNTPGLLWTTKYLGKGVGQPEANNVPILRLSEMYLNRAEAIVKGAVIPGASAMGDLTAITSNRGASAYAAAGMEAIKAERRKELAWEGHYFFDLARWNDSVVRPASWNLNPDYQNIPFPSYRWALPLPKGELEVNENLVQNDQYK